VLRFFFHLKHRHKDPTEERLLALFGFLTEEYGFQYCRTNLGNYTDRKGKLLFYGPYIAYSFYNAHFCLNILYLEQRDDYSVTVTQAFRPDGKNMEAGSAVSDYYAYHLASLAAAVQAALDQSPELTKDALLKALEKLPPIVAHHYSANNRDALQHNHICGCFYCLKIFSPTEINEWVKDTSGTAICPYCGVDSVIGEGCGYPITEEFLEEMHRYWF